MAWEAGIITLVGTLLIFAIAKWLIGSTKVVESIETVAPKMYGLRKTYFIFLLALIVVALFGTLRGLPYFAPGDAEPDYAVTVTGSMWSWEVGAITSRADGSTVEQVPAGKLIEFQVDSTDVNHGIAIYNGEGHILTQTQVMPGHPSKLYYQFETPGTYHLVCMEYCGAGHPVMSGQLQVN